MRKLVSVVVLIAAAAVGCGTEATTTPVSSPADLVQRNATAPLPHQDVPGFYSWDGDEWIFTPVVVNDSSVR